jgi:type IV secretory pathway VirB10-like protein
VSAQVIYWNSWAMTDAANLRFRRIRRNVSVPLLVFAVAVALLQIEKLPPREIPPVETHYAEILPPPIPPPPPKPQEVAVVEPMSRPSPVPVAKPVQVPAARPELTQEQKAEAARSRAEKAGASEIAKQLMALQSSMIAERVTSGQTVIGSTSAAPRAIATSLTREGHGSGGIDTGALSKGVGGAELSGRATARVVAAGGGGGGGAANGNGKGKGARDREEIEEVLYHLVVVLLEAQLMVHLS